MITNIMSYQSIRWLTYSIFILLLFTSISQAQLLKIVNCQGQTKASKILSSVDPVDVRINVKFSDLSRVNLINKEGRIIEGIIEDGEVLFADVPPDVWVLATDSPNAFLTSIAFEPHFFIPLPTFSEAAIVAGSVVGAAVLGTVIERNTSGNSGGGGGGGDDNSPSPDTGVCPDCAPDDVAPSIPEF